MTSKNWILVVAVLLALTGCPKEMPAGNTTTTATKADPASTAASSASSISIASINPDTGQPLRVGATVKVKVEGDYVLPSQGGMVGMVIQGADTKPIESSLKPVPGGSGKFVREAEFVVPNAKQVTVHVPLYVKGELKSAHVAIKHYQVGSK